MWNVGYGKGIEHKLGYQGGYDPFTQSDFRWLTTNRGITTKTDVLGNVVEKKYGNHIFKFDVLLFSIKLTKDFK